jgi:hypothetical protein
MNLFVTLTTLSLGLTTIAPVALDTGSAKREQDSDTRLSQTSQDASSASINPQGIGLTASHKQIIYDNIAGEQEQVISGDPQLTVGSTVPDAFVLNTMPIAVKDQIGLLKDYKFVKLVADKILIVDPANRKIVYIITKQEAGK